MNKTAVLLCLAFVSSHFSRGSGQETSTPTAYSVGVEQSLPSFKKIYNLAIALDQDRLLSKYALAYTAPNDAITELRQYTEIDIIDVKDGIFVRENRTVSACRAFNIESKEFEESYEFWIRMIQDLYRLGTSKYHKFIGTRKIRGGVVDTDVYKGIFNFTSFDGYYTTMAFNWHLLNKDWTELGSGENKEGHRRIMMVEIDIDNKMTQFSTVINYFNWQFKRPYLKEFTIERCYPANLKTRVRITFTKDGSNGNFGTITLHQQDQMIENIAKATNVSILRFVATRVMVPPSGNSIILDTTLLGHISQIPHISDTIIKKGKTLDQAIYDLKNKAMSGAIKVPGIGGVNVKSTGAIVFAEMKPQPVGKSYTPGAMAGLGIGMLIVGTLLGLVVVLIAYSVRQKQNPMDVVKLVVNQG